MADEGQTKEKEKQEEPKAEKTGKAGLIKRFLPWIILGAVVIIFAGTGFVLGRVLAGPGTTETEQSSQQNQKTQVESLKADDLTKDTKKVWYYDLEPVIANLDEPNVTRYVRASLILEIGPEIDQEKGKAFLDEKKPVLTNWLAIYLASLNLEDIRGEKNLKGIQMQILDAFNEKLFPDSKPRISQILFREFAIQ